MGFSMQVFPGFSINKNFILPRYNSILKKGCISLLKSSFLEAELFKSIAQCILAFNYQSERLTELSL